MIAVFAGNGDFPLEVLNSLKQKKIKHITLNLSKKKIKNSYNIQLGQFGKIINILKENKVKEVIFAGKVNRPNLTNLKFDLKALSYLPGLRRVFKKGDGNILNFCRNILKQNKIKVIESHKYCKDLLLSKTITKKKPTTKDHKDFLKGKKILDSLGSYDNAQGAVIDSGYIVALEAAEGTDLMLSRVEKIKFNQKNNSGVLIKLPKKNQSLKYDLPTIGTKTIKLCIKAKLNGIFLKKNQNIFLNKNKTIQLANKNNFFIAVK